MNHLPVPAQLMLPFLFSGWPYFMQRRHAAGKFAGLWVPSIHSLGTVLLPPIEALAVRDRHEPVS